MVARYIRCIPLLISMILIQGAYGTPALSGDHIRAPAAAGSFYPGSASQLRKTVSSLLDGVPEMEPEGEILAATAPHAGYVYSGSIAAHTFRSLSGVDFDTMVIIGHDTYERGVAFTCPADYFRTPLGDVPVDREMIRKMHQFHGGIKENRSMHGRDHTVEVQLPFLQVLGKECKIVPILFGYPTVENCRILSEAISFAGKGRKVFVLASTDMSHYPSYDSAGRVDRATLQVLRSLDVERLFSHLTDPGATGTVPNLQTAMCARGGVGTAMLYSLARGADHVRVLSYANSGDAPMGDRGRVVGYSAVLFVAGTAGR